MLTRIRIFALSALIAVGLTSFGGLTIAHGQKISPELGATRLMVTPRYKMAATKLPVPVVISHYKKCDLVSYAPELMAARTATPANDWHIIGKCKMSYSGESIPRFLDLQKDEAAWMCGCDNVVLQYPQHFARSNDFVIRFFTSKPGYFATEKPARVSANDVPDYYSHDQGGWVPFPDGSLHYNGPYQVFVVDRNHMVCAYGVWWTSGYVVGSNDFTVIPDRLIKQGVGCIDSFVIYPK